MKRLFTSTFLVLALLITTAGIAFAMDDTTITGTVQSVVIETNTTTNNTTALVTLLDANGVSQTVRINLQTAESLGLVSIDPATGVATVTADAIGKVVEIDSSSISDDDDDQGNENDNDNDNGNDNANDNTNDNIGENQHPVGSALSNFFTDLLGVDYESIMTFHEDGVGFGVIAQALWLTNNLEGDTATFEALLEAKQSGDYSTITLADGSTPDNWGDVVKSLKKGNNLGSVMSGRGENGEITPETAGNVPGNSNNNGSSNTSGSGNANNEHSGNNAGGNGNGNGQGNGNGNPNGHGNGNGNGQGNGQGNGHP
ncbi:MAG: hypothetical protein HY863_01845 [Chloroflexi bacterium]|nr:hypothetical protein [Chloroflexota bacterium]